MENAHMQKTEQKVAWENKWGTTMIYLSDNKEISEKVAQNSGLSGLHNGPADALRHSLFNALNTQVAGEKTAEALGNAHEEDRPTQDPGEKQMDLFNNAVGRQLGKENPNATPPQLAEKLVDKIGKGELLMLDENNKPVPTKITETEKKTVTKNIAEIYVTGEKQGTKYTGKDEKKK